MNEIEKLLQVLKITDILLSRYREVYRSHSTKYSYIKLGSGTNIRIDCSSRYMSFEALVGTGYHRLIHMSDWYSYISTLMDDEVLSISTNFNNYMVSRDKIYRESSTVLYKAANTFPQLPIQQSLSVEVLEPLMFQLMTKYTINEVKSMVACRYLCPEYLSLSERDNGIYPIISIYFSTLDKLSSQEVQEILEFLENEKIEDTK